MASADAATHDDHGHGNGKVPGALRGFLKDDHEWFYFQTWMILTGLFIISYIGPFIGEALHMFAITMVTAFGIAVVKAGLVIKRFMHLMDEPKFIWQMNATALVFILLFFFWVAPDVMSHEGANWGNQAGASITMTTHIEDFDPDVVWTERCATCHGEEGRGDGPAGTAIYPRPTDFTSRAYWATADHDIMATAILDGGVALGRSRYMPAFRTAFAAGHGGGHEGEVDTLPGERTEQLIARIMTFRPPPEAAPAPAPVAVPTREPTPTPTPEPVIDDTVALDGYGLIPGGEVVPAPAPAPTGPSEAELAARAQYIQGRVFN
ncbi:MAG: hypothetical protein DRJ42_05900 [Deltaproteobacteria bacterium]|nr:MAG: hypothetical protein DRJ42_05900 [Deltaproteobacteria bacterium]